MEPNAKINGFDNMQNDLFVLRAEELCYALRDAMIDFSLKYPTLSSFDRYIGRITNEGDLRYIVGLLHQCWLFANPNQIFNNLPKNLTQEQLLELALTKYNESGATGFDYLKEEPFLGNNPLLLAYYTAYKKNSQYRLTYGDYMKKLYGIVTASCKAKGLDLREGFIFNDYLTCRIDYSTQEKVYKVAVGEKLFDDNQENRHTFFSLFPTSPMAPAGRIKWLVQNEKNGEPSYSSLYVFLETIGVNMHSKREKEVVCRHFVDCQGQYIKVEQLKVRKQGTKLEDLAKKLKNAVPDHAICSGD